jgi:hypothetical protein
MKNLCFLFLICLLATSLSAQVEKSPDRNRGDGPYDQLIIRGVTLINGNGAPPQGPIDIVIENNIIKNIQVVGYPGVAIDPDRRPQLKPGGKELDCTGMYLLPGFVDMHGHIGGRAQGAYAEYVFKLWMAHGITTVRDPSCGNGLNWVLEHKKKSEANEITAPAFWLIQHSDKAQMNPSPHRSRPVSGLDKMQIKELMESNFSVRRLRSWMRRCAKISAWACVSACHHAQLDVARWNVLNSARSGLTTMEHWYGLPEALFSDRTVQDYPLDYNYQNEQHRFREAGRLWKQAAEPYSEHWNEVMEELLELDFTIDPTFNIYEASRDLMRARRAEWHEDYTLPSLWRFYQPSKISHGSYWHFWGTEEEVAWKKNYQLWMTFVNGYKNRGGRVTTGSDSGFIFQLYGFAYVRELEMLREAGFHPLEVIRSATLNGAEALGLDDKIGTVAVGKLADLVIVEENPLQNLKVLYGTGAIKLTEDNEVVA